MFDFVEQATFEPGDLLLATCTLRRQGSHSSQVLLGPCPRIFARVKGFSGNTSEQDQDFDLDWIVCRLCSTLLQFALTEPQLIGQDADSLYIPTKSQCDDRVPCFVIGSREIGLYVRSCFVVSQG